MERSSERESERGGMGVGEALGGGNAGNGGNGGKVGFGGVSPAMYKLVAAAHFSQSVLSSVACLVILCLTNFWASLRTHLLPFLLWTKLQSLESQSAGKEAVITGILVPQEEQEYLVKSESTSGPADQTKEEEEGKFVKGKEENNSEGKSYQSILVDTWCARNPSHLANMTIEVPAECPPPADLPVLRINSVTLEDPLLDLHSPFILSSSEGEEQESPLFTEDSELSSANEGGGGVGGLIRRDSDSSDVSSNDGASEDLILLNSSSGSAPEVSSRIISQVENMFSDDHLAKDGFLLKHVRRRSDGFVSLKLVAGLRKVKQISREFPVILTALKQSDKLEVNDEGTKIRRVAPLTTVLKALPIASQKNKEKEALSKSPSSSGDDLPSRNGNGAILHFTASFPVNVSASADHNKENKRQSFGKNHGKATRNNSNGNNKEFGGNKDQAGSKAVGRQNHYNNSANNNEREVVIRRRGGSLPIAMGLSQSSPAHPHRSSFLSPNSSPPTNFLPARPKSNSYCEGLMTSATMSPWLQRRKAASEGNVIISSVIRQPRGPDGTRGFAMAPRPLLIQAN